MASNNRGIWSDQALMGAFDMGPVEDSIFTIKLPILPYDSVIENATRSVTASMVEMIWQEVVDVIDEFVLIRYPKVRSDIGSVLQHLTTQSSNTALLQPPRKVHLPPSWSDPTYYTIVMLALPQLKQSIVGIMMLIASARSQEGGGNISATTTASSSASQVAFSAIQDMRERTSAVLGNTVPSFVYSNKEDLIFALTSIADVCQVLLDSIRNTTYLVKEFSARNLPGRLLVIKNIHAALTLSLLRPSTTEVKFTSSINSNQSLAIMSASIIDVYRRIENIPGIGSILALEVLDSIVRMQILLTAIPTEAVISQRHWSMIVALMRRVVTFGQAFAHVMTNHIYYVRKNLIKQMFLSTEEYKAVQESAVDDQVLMDIATAMYAKKCIQLFDMCLNVTLSVLQESYNPGNSSYETNRLVMFNGNLSAIVQNLLVDMTKYLQYHLSIVAASIGEANAPINLIAGPSYNSKTVTQRVYNNAFQMATWHFQQLTPADVAEIRSEMVLTMGMIEPLVRWTVSVAEPVLENMLVAIAENALYLKGGNRMNVVVAPTSSRASIVRVKKSKSRSKRS
jgi:hypothetical protein